MPLETTTTEITNVMGQFNASTEPFVLSDEERDALTDEIIELLEEYDYTPTVEAVHKILDVWAENNGNLLKLFMRHPQYNGKFQIAFSADFPREVNRGLIYEFSLWLRNIAYELDNAPLERFTWTLGEYVDCKTNDEFVEKINDYFPEVKAVVGQKTSRIVNKMCALLEINKRPEYNREYAKYADAINPLMIKRHTVLSLHPVDFLTMSFGNSWTSCHTIDKHNARHSGSSYSGCYSGGTLSYMLDDTSIVFYTVAQSYNGNELELEPKINRNMFHIGEDKIIQGRVYPQSTDGASSFYKEIREIVQKVIADCLNVPNLWTNKKGTNECYNVVYSEGVHYRDYASFGDCNVSYLKYNDLLPNENRIVIGHNPICPCCGDEHMCAECIECEDCYEDMRECADCGRRYNEDDMYYIDGEYYCEECCFYCEYHGEYETGEPLCVDDYGCICRDAFNYGDFAECEHCGEIVYFGNEEGIFAENGTFFCCESCAERHGYVYAKDGEWYPREETYRCEYCDEYVYNAYWNDEYECCEDCVEDVKREQEEAEEMVV